MKRSLLILFALFFLSAPAFAITYEELNSIKDPAYRVGTTSDIEQKYKMIKPVDTASVKDAEPLIDIEKLTYADLSIKKIASQIAEELEMEYDEMLNDLSLLWRGAATKSDIIKFAVYKLSNPEADKPNDKSIKKVLQSIASMSTLVGAGMGNPLLASGSFLGGNMLGIMSQDDKTINYKFSKVNDADMIILVRKVDDLQQKVVDLYYDYLTTRKVFDMSSKMAKQRYQNYQLAQGSSKEIILISDAYYRESLDLQMKARSDFFSKRAALEQLVGNDAFSQFEASINSRDAK